VIKIVLRVTLQLLDYSLYTGPRFGIINGNLTDWGLGGINFKSKVKEKIYILFVL